MGKRDGDAWKRFREKEDEQEQSQNQSYLKGGKGSHSAASPPSGSAEKFDELIQRADPMIDQLNQLYQMYISGAEKLAPIERRKQLDQIVSTLQMMSKPTPGAQFKFNSLMSKYTSYRERWERLIRDLEIGKIKRKGK